MAGGPRSITVNQCAVLYWIRSDLDMGIGLPEIRSGPMVHQ